MKSSEVVKWREMESFLFPENSPIVYDPWVEGQKIDDQGRFIIGPWAGPSSDIYNICHELCHFTERPVEKLKKRPVSSWGLYPGKEVYFPGRLFYETFTDDQVQTEARVWAYQMSLQRHFGIDTDVVDIVSSAVYLNAWTYYQPFAKKTYKDEPRIQKLSDKIQKMSEKEFTFERFTDEWEQRITALAG